MPRCTPIIHGTLDFDSSTKSFLYAIEACIPYVDTPKNADLYIDAVRKLTQELKFARNDPDSIGAK